MNKLLSQRIHIAMVVLISMLTLTSCYESYPPRYDRDLTGMWELSHINGYRVYLGGRWGKDFAHGKPVEKLFTSEEEVLSAVEKAILLFRDQGKAGERLSDTIERIGFDRASQLLESNELLERKAEVLSK